METKNTLQKSTTKRVFYRKRTKKLTLNPLKTKIEDLLKNEPEEKSLSKEDYSNLNFLELVSREVLKNSKVISPSDKQLKCKMNELLRKIQEQQIPRASTMGVINTPSLPKIKKPPFSLALEAIRNPVSTSISAKNSCRKFKKGLTKLHKPI